ncbi:electron transfer flavoprotein subunit beta/FixA family protein [Ferviditalea candida]|uniref:Electron transfer flavoprotein subunit beta n=1 Tax=Ferviditalea candida TaxID=3108399 RepID=A0ABU5ZIB6_9BACL|nr:electron transfer flavoprotein subunit beta/FixA family protein [Paenibacillaceae bacterium T2]
MNIYVLMKQTFDTEEKIAIRDGEISDDGVKYVINPYDEYAVEEAIRIRDDHGGSVTLVTIGPERSTDALRTALAMGADEAVLISDEGVQLDEYAAARALQAYLADKAPDLILGGNFSVDNGAGQVAIRLAQLLDIPHVGSITKLEVSAGKAAARRDAEGDEEIVEVTLPALFTAQQGLNEPRYPSLPGIMKAKKKPFARLSLDELGIAAEELAPKTVRKELNLPPARKAGRILEGELHDRVAQLVDLLRNEAKVI